jgi:hypothetical protein
MVARSGAAAVVAKALPMQTRGPPSKKKKRA